jgi:hypothetical protein
MIISIWILILVVLAAAVALETRLNQIRDELKKRESDVSRD